MITDGMRMQGITDQYGSAEAAVLAIEAGADAVLGIEDIDKGYHGVLEAVLSGRISRERIDASVRRILGAKSWTGLSVRRTVSIDSVFAIVGDPASRRISERISDASVTLLRNEKNLLPLSPSSHILVVTVTEDPSPSVGTDLVYELGKAASAVDLVRVANETGAEKFSVISERAGNADVMLVGIYLSVVAWKGGSRFSKPLENFLGSLARQETPVIVVAFGDPYILGKIPPPTAALTPFNGTYLAEQSVARAVTGRIPITGKLPVTIPGCYARGSGIRLERR